MEKEVSESHMKFDEIMDENNNLRNSLHEILDSVRNQDGESDVKIQSDSLEKILDIMDARHLWGKYHPAMGLKFKIEKLEGANNGNSKILYKHALFLKLL